MLHMCVWSSKGVRGQKKRLKRGCCHNKEGGKENVTQITRNRSSDGRLDQMGEDIVATMTGHYFFLSSLFSLTLHLAFDKFFSLWTHCFLLLSALYLTFYDSFHTPFSNPIKKSLWLTSPFLPSTLSSKLSIMTFCCCLLNACHYLSAVSACFLILQRKEGHFSCWIKGNFLLHSLPFPAARSCIPFDY